MFRFEVKFSSFRLEMKPRKREETISVRADFATAKEFVISWKRDGACLEPIDGKPVEFLFETCYGKELQHKLLCFYLVQDKVLLSKTHVCLQTLATGPHNYKLQFEDIKEECVLSFECHMLQRCKPSYHLADLLLTPELKDDEKVTSNFYIGKICTLDVWYITTQSRLWVERVRATTCRWVVPSFEIEDSVRVLEDAVFVFKMFCGKESKEFTMPIFGDYYPEHPLLAFKISNGLFSFSGKMRIENGPYYWPMRNGLVVNQGVVHGEHKRNFPLPLKWVKEGQNVKQITRALARSYESDLDAATWQHKKHLLLSHFEKEFQQIEQKVSANQDVHMEHAALVRQLQRALNLLHLFN